ncbi:hypothetical protein Pelo_13078 [Pelomyxa schiedti]|nr:hypothetical protein Pelo_13078 [Pelomyxa schiedti]
MHRSPHLPQHPSSFLATPSQSPPQHSPDQKDEVTSPSPPPSTCLTAHSQSPSAAPSTSICRSSISNPMSSHPSQQSTTNPYNWTEEELNTLEQAIIRYPANSFVDTTRYLKIAALLPNKTPQQVANRVKIMEGQQLDKALSSSMRDRKEFEKNHRELQSDIASLHGSGAETRLQFLHDLKVLESLLASSPVPVNYVPAQDTNTPPSVSTVTETAAESTAPTTICARPVTKPLLNPALIDLSPSRTQQAEANTENNVTPEVEEKLQQAIHENRQFLESMKESLLSGNLEFPADGVSKFGKNIENALKWYVLSNYLPNFLNFQCSTGRLCWPVIRHYQSSPLPCQAHSPQPLNTQKAPQQAKHTPLTKAHAQAQQTQTLHPKVLFRRLNGLAKTQILYPLLPQ